MCLPVDLLLCQYPFTVGHVPLVISLLVPGSFHSTSEWESVITLLCCVSRSWLCRCRCRSCAAVLGLRNRGDRRAVLCHVLHDAPRHKLVDPPVLIFLRIDIERHIHVLTYQLVEAFYQVLLPYCHAGMPDVLSWHLDQIIGRYPFQTAALADTVTLVQFPYKNTSFYFHDLEYLELFTYAADGCYNYKHDGCYHTIQEPVTLQNLFNLFHNQFV